MLKKIALALTMLGVGIVYAAPTGDTQGTVAAVAVEHNAGSDHNSFVVYFASVDNDRWGCIKNNAYIRVRSNAVGVDETNYRQLFSVALAAQASGRKLALSSSGDSPCESVNSGFMIN